MISLLKNESYFPITYLDVEIKPIHHYQTFHPYQYHLISIYDQVHYLARNKKFKSKLYFFLNKNLQV
jgi:hypothetical protein